MAVHTGDRAPGFRLPSEPGTEIDVAEHIGREKVVLLFFPLAFSPVCTREMKTVGGTWAQWERLGARVFGISVDSPFVTRKFREEEGIPFPILSDFNRAVAREYGVLHENLMGLEGVAKRAVFVIGTDGRVTYTWVSDEPGAEPDYDVVQRAAEEA
ncbi:MAG: redoxin domain-containing protein [Gemmatimonadota bacterium]